jgi:predicted acetyltransferase
MRDLWGFLLAIDWKATVKSWLLPPDHPLFLLLETPRRLRYRLGDSLWVRLVDVGAALSRRSYSSDESLVLEVTDEFCPWNEGRWKLEGGNAERTKQAPDLRLPVQSLGSAFLGGVQFAALARAGRVEEARQGALTRADGLFRWDRLPWCPQIF